MLMEIYLLFQIAIIVLFVINMLVSRHEIIWVIIAVLSSVLMVTSYHIEVNTFQFDNSTGVYEPVQKHYSYPYLMAINILFFGLSLLFGFFDVFERYGVNGKGGV